MIVDNNNYICISRANIAVLWVCGNVDSLERESGSSSASRYVKLHTRSAGNSASSSRINNVEITKQIRYRECSISLNLILSMWRINNKGFNIASICRGWVMIGKGFFSGSRVSETASVKNTQNERIITSSNTNNCSSSSNRYKVTLENCSAVASSNTILILHANQIGAIA